jgi:hypothetical protein
VVNGDTRYQLPFLLASCYAYAESQRALSVSRATRTMLGWTAPDGIDVPE